MRLELEALEVIETIRWKARKARRDRVERPPRDFGCKADGLGHAWTVIGALDGTIYKAITP